MASPRKILKFGLAVMRSDSLLLVRKKGGRSYILPGGKPEVGENDVEALRREIDEELGCSLEVESLVFLGEFSDTAADAENTVVTVRLYGARLVGSPTPQSEIECLAWFKPDLRNDVSLTPSIQNQIIPFLKARGDFTSAS